MPEAFDIFISYSQVAVFQGKLAQPFNDWTKEHVKQGFAWRPEAVSFKTLVESGMTKISWEVKPEVSVRPNTIRAIQVPFWVPAESIEIASITDGRELPFEAGQYLLIFEAGRNEDGSTWCFFSFVKDSSAKAAVLKIDNDIDPSYPLLMDATPAK